MKQYRYVVVQSDGISHELWPGWDEYRQLDDVESDEYAIWSQRATLPQLLADGWRPVRESPMGGTKDHFAYALVLLEKD